MIVSPRSSNNNSFGQRQCHLFLRIAVLAVVVLDLHSGVALAQSSSVDNNKENGGIVAGYLPDYRADGINITAAAPYLTDLILFSIQPHRLGMVGGCCLGDHHYELGRKAQEANKSLKVWVTIGGGGRTEAMPGIFQEEKKRSRLIKNILQLAQEQSIDGIDLNCFLPESPGFLDFLKEGSKVWRQNGLLVSLALFPHQFLQPKVYYSFVDRIHLMAYDMLSQRQTPKDSQDFHHATLDNMNRAAFQLIESGCPKSKIVVGIPGYARQKNQPQNVKTFADIYQDIIVPFTNEDNRAEIAHRGHTHADFWTWDSPRIVQQKAEYTQREGLGGVFFWELGQDYQDEVLAPGGFLVEAAHGAMKSSGGYTLNTQGQDEL